MNIFLVTFLVQLCAIHVQKSRGLHKIQGFPTVKYTMGAREIKGDARRRRQQSRFKQPISLKPPPEDWPAPNPGVADFLLDEVEATSLSPLQAYQAKLQEEYLKEVRKPPKKDTNKPPAIAKEEASIWTSSEEDFKKLLNPNELLKLNKNLAPLLMKNMKTDTNLKNGDSDSKQNILNVRSPPVKLATKRKTARTSKKKTTTLIPSQEINNGMKASSEDFKPSSEERNSKRKYRLKKRRLAEKKIGTSKPRLKKRKSKFKKFAFDTHRSTESDKKNSSQVYDPLPSRKDVISVLKDVRDQSSLTELGSSEKRLIHTSDENSHYSKVQRVPTAKARYDVLPTVCPETTFKLFTEFTTSTPVSETTTYLISPSKSRTTKEYIVRNASSERKIELRERRNRIKEEMKKVLEEEQLEGSFGDQDSQWTTSEEEFYVEYNDIRKAAERKIEALRKVRTTNKPIKASTMPKISLTDVTPRQALLGILRHKIVSFLDNILKSSPK